MGNWTNRVVVKSKAIDDPVATARGSDTHITMNTQSTYMQWAKKRPKVKYDLALSGILNLPFAELEATIDDIDLNGDNSDGYGPLVDGLAPHCQVDPESVLTIS